MLVSWNIGGLNKVGKIREIRSRLQELKLAIIILIETRVKEAKDKVVREKLMIYDKHIDNYKDHTNGRIWIHWDCNRVEVRFIQSSSQFIHCGVYDMCEGFKYWLTAVYAHNRLNKRRILWKEIKHLSINIQGPWYTVGDFNNVTKAQDRLGGNLVAEKEYEDLIKMMWNTGLGEMDSIGDHFTWSNKQTVGLIYSRIDRVLGNTEWFLNNLETMLKILPPNISDHAMLYLEEKQEQRKPSKHFKFSNCLIDLPGYDVVIKKSWDAHIRGSPMYVLWHKLKRLQHELKQFSKPLSDIKRKLIAARANLKETQGKLTEDRLNITLVEEAKKLTDEVVSMNELEWKILQQREKIDWIRKGDGNNHYFYAAIKGRQHSNCFTNLRINDGRQLTAKPDIEEEVINFYRNMMGKDVDFMNHIDIEAMRMGKQLNMEQREHLTRPISEADITKALKGIGDLKVPGLDGYGAKFFKAGWETVKTDVIAAVQEYFETGRIYKLFNSVVVSLIPKDHTAYEIKDYRPISICTTFYKIISKILTDRIGAVIHSVVSHNQAAFVPGQKIHSHIMLATELLKGYNRKWGTPRIMLQIDLQKAYDMVNWTDLECIMKEMGFPNKFIQWTMLGITTVSYRFNIMGEYTDCLQAKRGIRQGDPLSPMLFVLMMEYMNRLLMKMQKDPNFNYHAKCEKLQITNLTFADDVLLFCKGDEISLQMMLNTFKNFSNSTGLILNLSKCKIYFGGLDSERRKTLTALSGFHEGSLPFKYLGVLLSSRKLNINHFLPLVEKIVVRIHHWSSRLLSYAGRIQLVKSVNAAMVQYWMQCLPLPKAMIRKIESICRSFIWTRKNTISRKCPVAWIRTCCPTAQGRLNLLNL
ncbi:unnamed protein product [Lathyrus sativus]|nr:unnamed protein product [Lathyrus sativus]